MSDGPVASCMTQTGLLFCDMR